jgi:multiple sugar transport system ATP-binding protein
LIVETSSFEIQIPASKAVPFQAHAGRRVILGIRPEDIHDVDFQPAGITPALVEANVDVVEQMGNEMILYLEDKGKTFLARTDPRTRARVGGRLGVAFNIDNLHVFDADTNLSLSYEYKQDQPAKTSV